MPTCCRYSQSIHSIKFFKKALSQLPCSRPFHALLRSTRCAYFSFSGKPSASWDQRPNQAGSSDGSWVAGQTLRVVTDPFLSSPGLHKTKYTRAPIMREKTRVVVNSSARNASDEDKGLVLDDMLRSEVHSHLHALRVSAAGSTNSKNSLPSLDSYRKSMQPTSFLLDTRIGGEML